MKVTDGHLDEADKEAKRKYEKGIYRAETICAAPKSNPVRYADVLLNIKLDLVRESTSGGLVLDLCCGSALHLLELANCVKKGIAFDFSDSFLRKGQEIKRTMGINNVLFVEGNARGLPFKSGLFSCIYCFSSLYTIPRVEEVIQEIARTLEEGGKCIIELGNRYSLNSIVCKKYANLAQSYNISVRQMKRILSRAHLVVLEHKAFQLLPLWANKPLWLYPLVSPLWNKVMEKKIRGRMIDEYLSNLPLVRFFAFRHIFVCTK